MVNPSGLGGADGGSRNGPFFDHCQQRRRDSIYDSNQSVAKMRDGRQFWLRS